MQIPVDICQGEYHLAALEPMHGGRSELLLESSVLGVFPPRVENDYVKGYSPPATFLRTPRFLSAVTQNGYHTHHTSVP